MITDRVFDDAVDDLMVKTLEFGPVVAQVQGFGFAGEGCWGFDYDEVVDLVGEGVQAYFEPVQFGGHEDQVVDFSFVGVLGGFEDGETMGSTGGLDFIGGEEFGVEV